jgi:hypothetical protein
MPRQIGVSAKAIELAMFQLVFFTLKLDEPLATRAARVCEALVGVTATRYDGVVPIDTAPLSETAAGDVAAAVNPTEPEVPTESTAKVTVRVLADPWPIDAVSCADGHEVTPVQLAVNENAIAPAVLVLVFRTV